MADTTTAGTIAAMNDAHRRAFLFPRSAPGRTVMTRGFAALESDLQARLMLALVKFDAFTADNDPHGEHDFGRIVVEGAPPVFFKFDYYEDDTLQYGSEAPEDPARSYRVLTLMLAEEY